MGYRAKDSFTTYYALSDMQNNEMKFGNCWNYEKIYDDELERHFLNVLLIISSI